MNWQSVIDQCSDEEIHQLKNYLDALEDTPGKRVFLTALELKINMRIGRAVPQEREVEPEIVLSGDIYENMKADPDADQMPVHPTEIENVEVTEPNPEANSNPPSQGSESEDELNDELNVGGAPGLGNIGSEE